MAGLLSIATSKLKTQRLYFVKLSKSPFHSNSFKIRLYMVWSQALNERVVERGSYSGFLHLSCNNYFMISNSIIWLLINCSIATTG